MMEHDGWQMVEKLLEGIHKRPDSYKNDYPRIESIIPDIHSLPTWSADVPELRVLTCVRMCGYIERAGNNNMSNHYRVCHPKCSVGNVGDSFLMPDKSSFQRYLETFIRLSTGTMYLGLEVLLFGIISTVLFCYQV